MLRSIVLVVLASSAWSRAPLPSQTLTFPLTPPPAINLACTCAKDWDAPVKVPRFDPALGTLLGAEIRFVVQEPLYAGAAVLAENTTAQLVCDPEATIGAVFILRFDDGEWISGAATAWWFGGQVGHAGPFTNPWMQGRYLAPFDGQLDYLGPSAGGICLPPCGPMTPSVDVHPLQLARLIGTTPTTIRWQPRLGWYANRTAQHLVWARSLPIVPYYAEIIYTYQPGP